MNELLQVKETMSSLQIAEITGKQHAHVMRDIRNMVDSIKKSNESTSGLVGSEYHRGDRTQYKFLSEHTQNILLNFATGENLPQYQITETFYIDTKGEKRAMYNLNKKACLLLASGYNVVLRAKIIDRWEELETGKHDGSYSVGKPLSPIEMQLEMMKSMQLQLQELISTKEEVKQLKSELAEVRQRTTTEIEASTIVAYVTRNHIKLDVTKYGAMGRKASSLCKKRGIEVTKINDVRWGRVSVYPDSVLEEIFK